MRKFEYKAIPAPTAVTKAKGVKTTEDRFALSISDALNDMAEDGWEYVRAETLPCETRKGLTGSQTSYQNILIFRRFDAEPLPLSEPAHVEPAYVPQSDDNAEPEPVYTVNADAPEPGMAPTVRATYND